MDHRQQKLEQWLINNCGLSTYHLQVIRHDASFRRYFRVQLADISYIAMDAPPTLEKCGPYIAITKALRSLGLHTPEIIHSDIINGYLLITDFGDNLFLDALTSVNAIKLYQRALSSLAILQTCQKINEITIPLFTIAFIRQELELFKEWFLKKHLQQTLTPIFEIELNHCFDFLAKAATDQKQVFMHRDYHSANLMILPNNQIGILDFQDAFIGPITYDVVSLLRDCYITWPDNMVTQLVLHYWEMLQLKKEVDSALFLRWFDLMGLQRHLKALLTFSRKYHRDGNTHYLQHIPRTLAYIGKISARYPECRILQDVLSSA